MSAPARRSAFCVFLAALLGLVAPGAAVAAPMAASAPVAAPASMAASAPSAAPASAPEYQLKSAFIYNFATFVDWPDDIGKKLTLCVAAPREAMPYFTPLEGKPVGDMVMTVRQLGRDDSAEGCRILFVTDFANDSLDDWLSEVGDEEVLTISESKDWLKKGVVMQLLLQGRRVTFDVNLEAARGENITISSRLLRLAHKVYGLDTADDPANKKSR
jgi:hypothetical protein